MKMEPPTDNIISLKGFIRFQNRYQQKQFQKTKSFAASSALLNDTDIYSDDDNIIEKRIQTRKKLNYTESEIEKSTNNQSE